MPLSSVVVPWTVSLVPGLLHSAAVVVVVVLLLRLVGSIQEGRPLAAARRGLFSVGP